MIGMPFRYESGNKGVSVNGFLYFHYFLFWLLSFVCTSFSSSSFFFLSFFLLFILYVRSPSSSFFSFFLGGRSLPFPFSFSCHLFLFSLFPLSPLPSFLLHLPPLPLLFLTPYSHLLVLCPTPFILFPSYPPFSGTFSFPLHLFFTILSSP